jgi:hypothetical protein
MDINATSRAITTTSNSTDSTTRAQLVCTAGSSPRAFKPQTAVTAWLAMAVVDDAAVLTTSHLLPAAIDPPKSVTVAVTSDKGLCGGLNSNITKYTKALLQMYKGNAGAADWTAGPVQLCTTSVLWGSSSSRRWPQHQSCINTVV